MGLKPYVFSWEPRRQYGYPILGSKNHANCDVGRLGYDYQVYPGEFTARPAEVGEYNCTIN